MNCDMRIPSRKRYLQPEGPLSASAQNNQDTVAPIVAYGRIRIKGCSLHCRPSELQPNSAQQQGRCRALQPGLHVGEEGPSHPAEGTPEEATSASDSKSVNT